MTKWRKVKFGEIFDISSSKRVLQEDWKTSGIPFYRAREIVKLAKEGAVENELFISEELFDFFKSKYGVPKPGDLMISAVGTLGACYVVQPTDRFYYKDASVLRFSPKQEVCSKFIQHAFRTPEILDQIHAGSGSTVGTYTINRAIATRIGLPPSPNNAASPPFLTKPMHSEPSAGKPWHNWIASRSRFLLRCLGIQQQTQRAGQELGSEN